MKGLDSQQRELLPILTVFPFDSTGMAGIWKPMMV